MPGLAEEFIKRLRGKKTRRAKEAQGNNILAEGLKKKKKKKKKKNGDLTLTEEERRIAASI